MTAPAPPPLGFGIFGLGMVADFHAQAIAHACGARLAAVASRNAEKARAFAARHGAAFAGTTAEELVARPDVAVVCITTPASAHLAPALAAIRAGKHLVVEKPLEITVERTDEMLRAADAAGVKIAAIFQGRFGDGARTVKAAIDAGRFGRLVLATADVKWHRTAQYYTGTRGTWSVDGGGAFMAQAIHSIDLLQWYAGMPEEAWCRATRRVHTGIEAEDTAVAALKFPDGALGAITATTAAWPGWQRRIEICGEHGSAALEDDHITRWEFREVRPEDAAIRAAKDTAALGTGASAPNAISFVGHQRQIEDLVEALRDGREPACDGHEGRKAVALVRALYESAESGKAVRL
ncbi:MAG TPA: Gfo/Idh/MocA family oxidoreductase [Opitutus sp.]|nr:Gfo/Idh/MocA family oxidoreductase [Opitutus sp.]